MKQAQFPSRLANTLLLGLVASSASYGAGFQLAERSASGLGRAFSGEAAIADDASIIASNPAGMSLLDDMSFAFGANVILSNIDASGVGATGPISDNSVAANALVPYSFVSKKINDQWSIGFGTYTTYGLKSDYSSEFARGAATDSSELFSFNLNPAISCRINKQWTIGAGFDALYAN